MKSIQVRLLDVRINSLRYATDGSAGLDLCACVDAPLVLPPQSDVQCSTGVSIYLEDTSLVGLVFIRSSFGQKGIILSNAVGVIDSDYQGEIQLMLRNIGSQIIQIEPLTRIAQLVITRVQQIVPQIVFDFSIKTVRGQGGIGSTGL